VAACKYNKNLLGQVMSTKDEYCEVCGRTAEELHHIISRKQRKPLEGCKHNFIYLCAEHHRGTFGVHGKCGHALDQRYKLQFQNYLEIHFLKEHLTREEIKEVLEIADKPLDRLLSGLIQHNCKYNREENIKLRCNLSN